MMRSEIVENMENEETNLFNVYVNISNELIHKTKIICFSDKTNSEFLNRLLINCLWYLTKQKGTKFAEGSQEILT